MGPFFSAFSLALVVCWSRGYNSSKVQANRLYLTRTHHVSRRKPYHDASDISLYIHLDLNQNFIRLLLLNPGHSSEDIDCTLAEVNLDSNPEYTALSYTWGPPIRRSASLWTLRGIRQYLRERTERTRHSTIILDGRRVPVTPNLESALLHLRKPDTPLLLWVDAVCINQDDLEEKTHEVGLMRQIYSQAKQTIVWLGPEADGSNKAMDFIDTSDSIDVMDPKFKVRSISPPWPDLQALFARSWWSRMWVIQEALLSKQVIVKCGHREVGFEKFAGLAIKENALRRRLRTDPAFGGTYVLTSRWTLIPPTTPFYPILGIWRAMQSHRTLTFPLWKILVVTNQFNATLPRDKIYGLLGVCAPQDREAIDIDYTGRKTDAVLFKEAITYTIKSQNHIRPLQFVGRGKKTLELPSWVPDFSQPNYYFHSSFTDMGYQANYQTSSWFRLNHPILGRLVFDRLDASIVFRVLSRIAHMLSDSRGPVAVGFSDDDNVLVLRGIPFDTIAYADPAPDTGIFRESDAAYLDQTGVFILPDVLPAFDRWEKAVASCPPNPYQTSEGRYRAFWRTMIGNRYRGGDVSGYTVPPPSYGIGYELWTGKRPFPENDKETSQLMLTLGTFQGMAGRALTQRSFTITRRGFLGLTPDTARAGDLICVFQGGDVPFVVRPKSDDEWELVGECYIYGIMAGQAVKDAKPEDVRVYRLR
ncbi:heterokaryon incompatibility protein-domain-containing protein [Pholiota molesta]|nr:heterokaryon incompatibility protein-domain-containing protein [Pholiota molesta]